MSIYVGDLITQVRRDTDNVDFSVDANQEIQSGISTEDFLRYINFGLLRITGRLIQNNIRVFERQKDISLVANQANYTIDDNVYLGESIVDVQYSSDGQEQNFREIKEINESYRKYDTGTSVCAYSRRGGSIFVSPVPSTSQGTLRVTYNRMPDQLDIRRGTIDANDVSTQDTLSLADSPTPEFGRINAVGDKYLCFSDKDGNVTAYNMPYTSVATSTPFTFVHAAHTLGTGESVSNNDFVTVGKYTATHFTDFESPDIERYLQLYCAFKIFKRDSSSDSVEAARELNTVEQDIIESYQSASKDEGEIQISDPDLYYLDPWGY